MTRDKRTVAPVLRRYLLSLLTLLVICFAVQFVRSTLLKQAEGTYTSFLFREWFPDLMMHVRRFQFFHSAEFFRFRSVDAFMYPAPVAVVYELFYIAPGGPVVAYLVLAAAAIGVFGFLFARGLTARGVAAAEAVAFTLAGLLCSYPLILMIKQGNTELVVWIIVTSGIVLFLSGYDSAAAICFGLAASLKLYPFVFFGLFLRHGQIRRIALGAAVFAVAEVGSLWLVCPQIGTAWRGISEGLAVFREGYMLPIRPEIGADHSLFVWVKLMQRIWHYHRGELTFDPSKGSYLTLYLATTAIAGTGLFLVYLRKLPVVNQLICLTIASVWLPPVSFEYTLVQLLAPMAMLMLLAMDGWRRGERLPGSGPALGCFAVIMAAFPELTLNGNLHSGQLKAVALLLLFGAAMRYPFDTPQVRDGKWRAA